MASSANPTSSPFNKDLVKSIESIKLKNEDINVTIEGNLSAGKSYFLDLFKEIKTVKLLPEPIALWTNFKGTNLLKEKYENKNDANQIAFQTIANLSRIHQANLLYHYNTVKIYERSLASGFNIFVKHAFEKDGLGEIAFQTLKYSYEVLTTGHLRSLSEPDVLVYIRTSPEICLERLKKRNRTAERTVSLEFLQEIHAAHERWIKPNEKGCLPNMRCSVIIIDGNVDKDKLALEGNRVLREIMRIAHEKFLKPSISESISCENGIQ